MYIQNVHCLVSTHRVPHLLRCRGLDVQGVRLRPLRLASAAPCKQIRCVNSVSSYKYITRKPPHWPDRLIGITGSMASGKSTATVLLGMKGFKVFSADVWAREAVRPGGKALAMLEDSYGDDILASDGSLDRKKLLKYLLLSDTEKVHIESIIHPEVFRIMDRELSLAKNRGYKQVVVEVPLLFETGMEKCFDMIVVITADLKKRINRVVKRNGIGKDIAEKWLRKQIPQEEKASLADIVIDNSGSLLKLEKEIKALAGRIAALSASGL